MKGFMDLSLRRPGWLIAGVLLLPQVAIATGHGTKVPGMDEAILVSEIVLLVFMGRLLGELMLRIGQPTIVGQLLAGVLLGPSIFGAVWPQAHDLIFPHEPAQKATI